MPEETQYKPNTRWGDKVGPQEDEPQEDSLFFTVLRQQGAHAPQITFILKSKRYHTLATHEIEEMYFEPSQGIVLFFRFGTVHIEGRNLGKLHNSLRERKVSEIREFSENAELFFDKEALFISSIHYESENMRKWGMG